MPLLRNRPCYGSTYHIWYAIDYAHKVVSFLRQLLALFFVTECSRSSETDPIPGGPPCLTY